jgi:hypothetical protein
LGHPTIKALAVVPVRLTENSSTLEKVAKLRRGRCVWKNGLKKKRAEKLIPRGPKDLPNNLTRLTHWVSDRNRNFHRNVTSCDCSPPCYLCVWANLIKAPPKLSHQFPSISIFETVILIFW